jgi:hypothetical protein
MSDPTSGTPSLPKKPRKPQRYSTATARARMLAGVALLETGATYETVNKATGLASNTIAALKAGKLITPEEGQNIKESLERRQLLICSQLADGVTQDKINNATLSELGTAFKAFKPSNDKSSGDSYAFTLSQFLVQAPPKQDPSVVVPALSVELSPIQQVGMNTEEKDTTT